MHDNENPKHLNEFPKDVQKAVYQILSIALRRENSNPQPKEKAAL